MRLAHIVALNGNRTDGLNVTEKPLPFDAARTLFKALVEAGVPPKGAALPVLVLVGLTEGAKLVHKFKAKRAARRAEGAGDVPEPPVNDETEPAAPKAKRPRKTGGRNPGDGQA